MEEQACQDTQSRVLHSSEEEEEQEDVRGLRGDQTSRRPSSKHKRELSTRRQQLSKALQRRLECFDNHKQAFPFLDPTTCWDLEEFVKENHRAIQRGLAGRRLVDHLCRWASHGRLGILLTDRETYLFVRTWDKEEALIHHHLYPLSRGCGLHITMIDVKTPEELESERRKMAKEKDRYYTADDLALLSDSDTEKNSEGESGDDESDHQEDLNEEEEEDEFIQEPYPFKEQDFVKLYRISAYARRFDAQTFDPSPAFFEVANANPNGTNARTLNSWKGLLWTAEKASQLYEQLSPGQRTEADRRAALLMDHIKLVACRGDAEMVTYLLRWILSLVLHPERRMLTMLVFVGDSGCGKTVLAQNILGPLFGSHYGFNSDLGDILGKFNGRLENVILAYADEARVASRSRASAQLKTLITEFMGAQRLEHKGRDVAYNNNFCNFIASVEDMVEFQVDLGSRRFQPYHFAGDRRGQKPYFDALVAAAQEDKRMGLLAFLVHMMRTVDLADFDRGQILPKGRGEAIRGIMSSTDCLFRQWAQKWINRDYIVPRNELDDTDVVKNEHIAWLDPQGRTWDTRREPWICEIQSEVVYARFRKDMGVMRGVSDSDIKKGLKAAGLLHPECHKPLRRRVNIEERSRTGAPCFILERKTYLTMLRRKQVEKLLNFSQQGQEEIAKEQEIMDVTPEEEEEFDRCCLLVDGEAEGQRVKEDKGKEKMVEQEVPDDPTWPPNEITDKEHAALVAMAELNHAEAFRRSTDSRQHFASSPPLEAPSLEGTSESIRKDKRQRTGQGLRHQPLSQPSHALGGAAEDGPTNRGTCHQEDHLLVKPQRKRFKKKHHGRAQSSSKKMFQFLNAMMSAFDDETSSSSDNASDCDDREQELATTTTSTTSTLVKNFAAESDPWAKD